MAVRMEGIGIKVNGDGSRDERSPSALVSPWRAVVKMGLELDGQAQKKGSHRNRSAFSQVHPVHHRPEATSSAYRIISSDV